VEPDAVLYSAPVRAYAITGQWECALFMMEDARRKGASQGSTIYNAGLRACQAGQNWMWALECWHQSFESRVQPNIFAYNSVMDAYSRSSEWHRIFDLIDHLRETHLQPDAVFRIASTLTTWTSNATSKGEHARKIFFDIKHKSHSLKVSEVTCNAIIKTLAAALFGRRSLSH